MSISEQQRYRDTQLLHNQLDAAYESYITIQQQMGRAEETSSVPALEPKIDQPGLKSPVESAVSHTDNSSVRSFRPYNVPGSNCPTGPGRDRLRCSPIWRNSTTAHGPIRRNPEFDLDRYRRYKDEISLWAEARGHSSASALVSAGAPND